MQKAILERNFETFARLTMIDSNQLHSVCQDTFPPIRYMNDISWEIVSFVHHFNAAVGAVKLAYTFDAGPNAFLFCLDADVPEILHVSGHFIVMIIIIIIIIIHIIITGTQSCISESRIGLYSGNLQELLYTGDF